MKFLPALMLAVTATAACAQTPAADYPSCDLPVQRDLTGTLPATDPGANQQHLQIRANILEADIGTARKARYLSEQDAAAAFASVQTVRRDAESFAEAQGFVSAAERASYDRQLDAVATTLCNAVSSR